MRWKLLSAGLLVLLPVTNLATYYGTRVTVAFYDALDKGVTTSHREQLLYEYANGLKAMSRLCGLAVAGKSSSELAALLRAQFPEEKPFGNEDNMNVPWLSIGLDENGRGTTCLLDDLVEDWASPQSERE